MDAGQLIAFVDGPEWASDLARIEVDLAGQETLVAALDALIHRDGLKEVSHRLSSSADIHYLKTRDFPSLGMPPLYMTFRIEQPGLVERRRIFTEADIRAGLLLEP